MPIVIWGNVGKLPNLSRKIWERMSKLSSPGYILFNIFVVLVIVIGLVILALIRSSVPVNIDVELTNLGAKLAASESTREYPVLLNVDAESITLMYCQEIMLAGDFSVLQPGKTTQRLTGLHFIPEDSLSSIEFRALDKPLRLDKLIVGHQARIDINASFGFEITEDRSFVKILIIGDVEILWECFLVKTGVGKSLVTFAGGSGQLKIKHDVNSAPIIVRSDSKEDLLNVSLRPSKGTNCMLEKELLIDDLSFVKQRSGYITTTIKKAIITFPTLSNEEPIILPEGSYLEIDNLHDFTLKSVNINRDHISASLYGYTNNLQAAYGRGRLIQLIPATLILLRQNTLIVIIVAISLWSIKTIFNIMDYFRKKKEEE